MRGTVWGFLITLSLWGALVAAYAIIELVRGHVPFAMLQWDLGGKFLTITILLVLALGAGIGFASDRIRSRADR